MKNERESLNSVFNDIKKCCQRISQLVRFNNSFDSSTVVGNNKSDDEVKKLDVESNEIFIKAMLENDHVIAVASEEEDDVIFKENGEYLVAFDPLDGSSNIDCNITIGSIFTVVDYGGVSDSENVNKDSIKMSGYCVYGGSTQLVVAMNKEVKQYNLDSNDENVLSLPKTGKIYSINHSNQGIWENKKYNQIIEEFVASGYSMRWVGCLVADAHRTLVKGGFFAYPCDRKSPNGKLRLVYECIPMSHIFLVAGGKSYISDSNDTPETLESLTHLLSTALGNNIHVKSPLILSSN